MALLTSQNDQTVVAVLDLSAVIRRGIRSAYQPIVDLVNRGVIGYEALARGPVGSALELPGALFGAAARLGLTAELDRACRAAAFRGAADADLPTSTALFVNVEPAVIDADLADNQRLLLNTAGDRLNVFFEVTERALTSRPAELLDATERVRAAGFGIALDDVGADPRSLALLPLLRPDVVKLDMSLIHNHPSRQSGEVMNGVCAYAEQTGAAILAEGVETERHLLAAQSLGATLGQGWLFGRPGPVPRNERATSTAVKLGLPPRSLAVSPAELVHAQRGLRVGRKDVLLSITRALEAQALDLGGHAIVASAFQHARHFTARSRSIYERLGRQTGLTVALGTEMTDPPASGVRGAALAPDDPLVNEWDIAVVGPHYAGALVARDLGDQGPDHERRFEFVLTFDRDLVIEVAASLIARVSPTPPQ